ncbi:hypothetical protein KCU92_g379, partial [Aureobasidium melanogenum]
MLKLYFAIICRKWLLEVSPCQYTQSQDRAKFNSEEDLPGMCTVRREKFDEAHGNDVQEKQEERVVWSKEAFRVEDDNGVCLVHSYIKPSRGQVCLPHGHRTSSCILQAYVVAYIVTAGK